MVTHDITNRRDHHYYYDCCYYYYHHLLLLLLLVLLLLPLLILLLPLPLRLLLLLLGSQTVRPQGTDLPKYHIWREGRRHPSGLFWIEGCESLSPRYAMKHSTTKHVLKVPVTNTTDKTVSW